MMVVAPGHEMKDFSTLYGSLKDDVSKSIRNLGREGSATDTIKFEKLADDLDELQKWKKENIDIYERTDSWFQQLIRESTEGGKFEVGNLGAQLLQDKGKLLTLLHLKELMPKGYDALKRGLQDEILSAPSFQTRSGEPLVDLEVVAKQLKGLRKGFKDELFGSPEAVASLEKAVNDFRALKKFNASFGGEAIIPRSKLLEIKEALLVGPEKVQTVVKEVTAALRAEAIRTKEFDNDLYAAFKDSDIAGINLIKQNQDDFVESLVFRDHPPPTG